MDKQKSYGKNYETSKLKHSLSLKFVLGTFFACVVAVAMVVVCLGVNF